MLFSDRRDAGIQLAKKLTAYKDSPDVLVLGLPRGGVITAAEVARELGAPLDIVVTRKIGAPFNEEYALGAVTVEGEPFLHTDVIESLGVSQDYLDKTIAAERREAKRRLEKYRGSRPPVSLKGKIVILVDDGVATGATMRAAIRLAKQLEASKIVVATPVIAPDTLAVLKAEADEVAYLDAPDEFAAVGQFYAEFPQTTDEEVINLLK